MTEVFFASVLLGSVGCSTDLGSTQVFLVMLDYILSTAIEGVGLRFVSYGFTNFPERSKDPSNSKRLKESLTRSP